ncbi:lysylphosphatidylglycerol synthase domain-containing protein [Microbacterium sp. B2969]|uniref:Lysylphosphatidylglycerol synthase domain-containing protein n=1 Tax=Microbacterium alkaliflavum TaxID=3248839 RepID=A0ABW7QCJ8_9MICO
MTSVARPVATRPALRAVLASPRARAIAKAVAGFGILVAIIAQAGADPFLRGLSAVSGQAVVAALVLAAIATSAAAWRWRLIARGLEVPIGQAGAVAAYYRSQFLNTVLPGGVVGDVHRAVAHGRSVGRVGNASRAVAAERAAGQAVQVVLAAAVLAVAGLAAYAPAVGAVLLAVVVASVALLVAAAASVRVRSALRRELALVRGAFASTRVVAGVVVASVVVACHVATFVVAGVAVGLEASPRTASVAVVAVLAGTIPLNVGGWGPREGVAGWAAAAVGFGSATGVAASTAYGVLAMIAVAPGAAVVAAAALTRRRGHAAVAVEIRPLAAPGEESSP